MCRTLLPALTVLALAACSAETDPNDPQNAQNSDPALSQLSAMPLPSQSPGAVAAAAIPAAMLGRWGLVAADCTSTRGDAKGLVLIEPTGLKFYESIAQLGAVSERSDAAIRASFEFTGEGMDWTREMALELGEAGKTLVRREFGSDAASEPFEYRRCPGGA